MRGGTDTTLAPPADYITHVLMPTLRRLLGVQVDFKVVKRGFYPRGGGVVLLTARAPSEEGATLPAFDLTQRGELRSIKIEAFTAGQVPDTVGQRLAASTAAQLKRLVGEQLPGPIPIRCYTEPKENAVASGCSVLAIAETSTGLLLGGAGVGQRGLLSESIGERVGSELGGALASGACVDEWMQDQLIIYMALAKGTSRMLCGELTLHTRTAIAVAQQLTAARFTVTRQDRTPTQQQQHQGQQRRPGSNPRCSSDREAAHNSQGAGPGDLWLVECEGAGIRVHDFGPAGLS